MFNRCKLQVNDRYYLVFSNKAIQQSLFEHVNLRQMNIKEMQLFGQKYYGFQLSLEELQQRFKELEGKGVVDLYELTKPNTIKVPSSTGKHGLLKRIFFIKDNGSEGYYPVLYFYYICVLLIVATLVPISFFELIWQLMLDILDFIINTASD